MSETDALRAALQKREHHFRNAVEGEYDANLLQKARHALEAALATPAPDRPAEAAVRDRDFKAGWEAGFVEGNLEGTPNYTPKTVHQSLAEYATAIRSPDE